MSKKQIAFTLIELLVVIAIIGILSGLIVVTMNGVTAKANIAKSQIFSNSLRNALMLNLVSEWKFDEGTGQVTSDSWSGGNTGTLIGPTHLPTWKTGSDCVNGSCIQFDGIDDYVGCGTNSNLDITGDITIAAWINPLSLKITPIVRKGYTSSPWSVAQNAGAFEFFYTISSTWGGVSASVLSTNQWQFIVATRSFSGTIATLKLYKNGIVRNSTTITGVPDSSSVKASLGYDSGGGQFFHGLIDDVRIYNAAIPTSQIKEQYYLGLNNLLKNGSITEEEYSNRISEIAIK